MAKSLASAVMSTISAGGYSLPEMLGRIDTLFASGRLDASERESLYEAAREGWRASDDLPPVEERLWRLEEEVARLSARVEALEGDTEAPDGSGGSPDVSGTEEEVEAQPYRMPQNGAEAYMAGDLMLWTDGLVYEAVRDGVVWGPDHDPTSWREFAA